MSDNPNRINAPRLRFRQSQPADTPDSGNGNQPAPESQAPAESNGGSVTISKLGESAVNVAITDGATVFDAFQSAVFPANVLGGHHTNAIEAAQADVQGGRIENVGEYFTNLAVNGEPAGLDAPLTSGDVITMSPRVVGG